MVRLSVLVNGIKCCYYGLWNVEFNFNKVISKCGSFGLIMGDLGEWELKKD